MSMASLLYCGFLVKLGDVRELWATEATVSISFTENKSLAENLEKMIGIEPDTLAAFNVKVEINWTGSSRSVLNASTALSFYRQAVDLASRIETYCEGKCFVCKQ
jgi:hypothetical protein